MAKKLAFLLTDRTAWRLPFKTALATLTLLFVLWFDFSLVALAVFFTVFVSIYFSQITERRLLKVSFWFLPIFSLIGIKLLLSSFSPPLFIIIALALFAFLFFILLGLMSFFFKDKFLVYGIFNTSLLLLLFLLVFHLGRPDNFWFLGIVLFFMMVLIFEEVFKFFGIYKGKRTLAALGIVGILAVEIAWLTSFLPLGFINAAVFLTLFFLLVRDSLAVHFRGFLNLSFIFRELAFFVFITLIIFAASQWSI
ncbi:MAG: hypothetical protein KJI72_01805 [Patescibacteria group bacterium]|nr:hypothetical protein [Patescibacteria group bacterium]